MVQLGTGGEAMRGVRDTGRIVRAGNLHDSTGNRKSGQLAAEVKRLL